MNIAKYIDHTILKPETQKKDVVRICDEAKEYGFYSVCVNSSYVPLVKEQLQGSDVKITAVVGFPLGAMDMKAKAYETEIAIENGANEIDMVINIGALKDKEYDYVREDIMRVVDALQKDILLKVIIETSLLTEEEKIKACELSMEAGAHFVKTSTGFSTGGATIEDVKLMRRVVGDRLGVKASGGIRNYETAIAMIEAGASRLGVSASVAVVNGMDTGNSGY
ncbi:deoxyribose-phosphate aldolase [Anaerosolibacter carboniphilus]|uniref:Deoxyribose-phosphate aldolase n=1 Tax=Anaerosolibacter carboniphilus TaxID=1417629 RepID=A0A841KTW5_9FIRM|nr:deoxyribose-phosphate aldolase [Anaerosolibacter carboniphilus]MBB6217026.1 deoxyribose-phosphate aldolase [Anaerosolibacter carboniphilus]